MKRRLFKLGLFVLAGAIVNVAVAWGCAGWPGKSRALLSTANWKETDAPNWTMMSRWAGVCDIRTYDDRDRALAFLEGRGSGEPNGSMVVDIGAFPRWSFPRSPDWLGASMVNRVADDRAAGWPSLCVRCRFVGSQAPDVPLQGGIRLPPKIYSDRHGTIYVQRALPIIPIFPGFAINTIFYGAILWVLFAAPGTIRRSVRRGRGLCPACAYPVGASETCSECGKPVKAPSVEPVA